LPDTGQVRTSVRAGKDNLPGLGPRRHGPQPRRPPETRRSVAPAPRGSLLQGGLGGSARQAP